MGKFSYDVYSRVGYHPQTCGHEKMIDDIITERGVEGARKYIKDLEKSKRKKRKKQRSGYFNPPSKVRINEN